MDWFIRSILAGFGFLWLLDLSGFGCLAGGEANHAPYGFHEFDGIWQGFE